MSLSSRNHVEKFGGPDENPTPSPPCHDNPPPNPPSTKRSASMRVEDCKRFIESTYGDKFLTLTQSEQIQICLDYWRQNPGV